MEQQKHVLVVDDDESLLGLLKTVLEQSGFTVLTALNGLEGEKLFRTHPVHAVLLDIMMPYRDGFSLCRDLRAISNVPIIMLTARTDIEDVVKGLELGADDYITKPFKVRELVARVSAVMSRAERQRENETPTRIKTVGDISIDLDRGVALVKGSDVALTPIEFELLNYLMTNAGRLLDRETLLHDVWGYDYSGRTNLVDVAMRRLREKIESDPSSPTYVQTVRGQGYRFAGPAPAPR